MSLIALLLTGALLEPSPLDPCDGVTEAGARSRLCMDPGHGVALSAAGGVWSAAGALDLAAELRLSGQWESTSKVATWLQLHRLGATSVKLNPDAGAVRGTLYQGHWRRHVAEPYLSLPTNPPRRLPFPFDIAFDVSALTFEHRLQARTAWTLEVLRGALLLDLLRSSANRFHLAVGPEVHYVVRHDGSAAVHELAPFTGGMLYLWFASEDGRWLLSLRGTLGAAFSVDSAAAASPLALQGRAELTGERVLLSLNDQPLSLTLRAGARFHDVGPALGDEWGASVGLSLRLFGSR